MTSGSALNVRSPLCLRYKQCSELNVEVVCRVLIFSQRGIRNIWKRSWKNMSLIKCALFDRSNIYICCIYRYVDSFKMFTALTYCHNDEIWFIGHSQIHVVQQTEVQLLSKKDNLAQLYRVMFVCFVILAYVCCRKGGHKGRMLKAFSSSSSIST